jgi:hypothetical protein
MIPRPPLVVLLPPPGAGGVVGRTKISDDNSPLPRDRIIFNYDYFDAAPLSANGANVNRFSVGFEKTFFEQNASVEVRLPFASTLSSDVTADGATGYRAELGNLNLTFKALLYGSPTWNLAAGMGVALPTASDLRVRFADGTDLLRLKNDSVLVTPYVAALYTPNDRLFAQGWIAYGFDATGNALQVATPGGGLAQVGRFTDQTLAQLDAQVGYWLYQASDRSARLQRLAPFFELHVNATVSRADVIRSGDVVFGTPGNLGELNVSAGLIAQLGDNFNLVLGMAAPLRGTPNRTFDYQIGVHGNVYFGATARARSAAAQVSSF